MSKTTSSKTNNKMKIRWGVSIYVGTKKIKEIYFKTEKDMAWWLYENDK